MSIAPILDLSYKFLDCNCGLHLKWSVFELMLYRITIPVKSGRISRILAPSPVVIHALKRQENRNDANHQPLRTTGRYIGIDPDVNGAVGVIDIDHGVCGDLISKIHVIDIPHVTAVVNGKNRKRVDAEGVVELVENVRKSCKSERVAACLEAPFLSPASGKMSYQLTGYMFGLWHGVLLAKGIQVETVNPAIWKRRLNLQSKQKQGSLELARMLFPSAEGLLLRKKDHGRAEALLLAAYGFGIRLDENGNIATFDQTITSRIQAEN